MKISAKEKRGMQNKKAVSEILATILIVLFVIAALVIVSVVLFQFIRKQSQEITAGCVTIDILITKAKFNATTNITIVYLKRAAGDADMTGMKFIFDGKEKIPSAESDDTALKLLETGEYVFKNITSKPKKIEAAPIIRTEADKEMNCGIKSIIREKDIAEKAISVPAPAPQFQDIRTGLVAEWKFDEGSGTTASDTAGSSHGTLVNGPLWTTGKKGGALSFDGVNDYVNAASSSIPSGTGAFEAWVYPKGYDSDVVSSGVPGNDFRIYLKSIGSSNYGFYVYREDRIITALKPPLNEWTHLVLVWNSSGTMLYFNGNFQAQNTVAPRAFSQTGINIGRYTQAQFYFNGLIDEVRIYNRALSAAEIQQIYQFYQQG